MLLRHEVDALLVSVRLNQQPLLFIMLTRDGGINRMGDGDHGDDKDMLIGKVSEPIFDQVMAFIPDATIGEPKTCYRAARPKGGNDWEVSFVFRSKKAESGVCIRCGDQGLPTDLGLALRAAMDLTEPWYQSFKALANSAPPKSA